MKTLASLAAVTLWFFAGTASGEEARWVPVVLSSGTRIMAEVADTPVRHRLGLMYRDSLPPDRAMLFIYPGEDFHGIWMKNCRIPLDIVWLNSERRVIQMEEEVPPCRTENCPVYTPSQKNRYVLELPAGLIRREQIHLGSRIDFRDGT